MAACSQCERFQRIIGRLIGVGWTAECCCVEMNLRNSPVNWRYFFPLTNSLPTGWRTAWALPTFSNEWQQCALGRSNEKFSVTNVWLAVERIWWRTSEGRTHAPPQTHTVALVQKENSAQGPAVGWFNGPTPKWRPILVSSDFLGCWQLCF